MPSSIVAGVEIGTAKIVVLVAELYDDWSLNIIGCDTRKSQGLRKGAIVDFRAASDAVHEAIDYAEAAAGVRIPDVFLALSGGHLKGNVQVGTAQVSGGDGRVTADDVKRAVEEAKRKSLPADRVFIHHIRNPFVLDGREVDEPLDLMGEKIEVGYWSVHADARQIQDRIHIFNALSIEVKDIILSSVASARMAVDDAERKGGCIVIDMGAGTTDYALYLNGYIARTGVIPVGGDHLTNDLAIGLQLNPKRSEEVKCDLGRAIFDSSDSQQTIKLYGDNMIGDRSLPLSSVTRVLQCRLEETFERIAGDLGELLRPEYLGGGVILTGGGSKLKGIEALAESVFGVEARLSRTLDWVAPELQGPEFSTVLGILHFGQSRTQDEWMAAGAQREGWLSRMARLLKVD